MSEADIRGERLRKVGLLKDAGMDPYPADSERTHTIAEFLQQFESLEKNGDTVILAGRIMALRGQGGIMFADLFDGTARAQAVIQKEKMDDSIFALFADAVDVGDFIQVPGTAFTTKRGEKSLQASAWKMLAKSLSPIPDEWFGLKDPELKGRLRAVDLLLSDDLREMFIRKAKFWQAIREFLLARGFIEVETPALETSPGGADARPFVTHHHALDIDVYLRISAGELWQKRLLVAGFPKVFEIGRIFRNEGQSREHLQDYTQLETYEAFSSLKEGGDFVKQLYRHIAKEVYGKYTFEINGHTVDLAEEWSVVDFCAAIKKEFGID
ncbi:MAG TPA: amino acid--tRNA ligase-related protein, partial [Candidatus Paceibacterota bacterium]|nr:amino acid--tRNA ligase-related protein [Candidatus Paceibacterota bacterium]